ncbi:MAG: single-stranded DNA-binding protein [Patescibacteria group bacterium]|nr:single-stranded DNA-binding protein [Patescibacteria group bacterium]
MSTWCLNKAALIGNLTNDPDLRYTPGGVAVCSFGLATNRRWTTQDGEKKELAQFHRIVAWSQLAEICSQLLSKGCRVYVEGRIQYREWIGSDNNKRQTTEIVIEDMILLDSKRTGVSVEAKERLGDEASAAAADGSALADDFAVSGPSQSSDDSGAVSDSSEEEVKDKEDDSGQSGDVSKDKKVDDEEEQDDAEGQQQENKEEKDIPF